MPMSDLHPSRYPKHEDPEKGQVHGGECNRTACVRGGAVFWNTQTLGFYCPACANGINIPGMRICFPVKAKPTLAEMTAPGHRQAIEKAWHDALQSQS